MWGVVVNRTLCVVIFKRLAVTSLFITDRKVVSLPYTHITWRPLAPLTNVTSAVQVVKGVYLVSSLYSSIHWSSIDREDLYFTIRLYKMQAQPDSARFG